MSKILLLLVLLTGSLFGAVVTISGPLYQPNGTSLANGTLTISWQNFTGADGHYHPASSKTITVTNGAFTQLMESSTNSSPHFSYKITYKFGSSSPAQCSWVVGTSNATIPDIETCPTPASSIPATGISLSMISAGGGSDGECVIVDSGALTTSACTNFWTRNVNDIYNSNTANVGIGGTPGAYKLDISKSGASGGFRLYDQTAVTGATQGFIRAGAGQSTTSLFSFQNNAGTVLSAFTAGGLFQTFSSGNAKIQVGLGYASSSDALTCWSNNVNINAGSYDLGLYRNAAGVLEVNNCGAGTFRDMKFRGLTLTNLASASVQCVHVDSVGTFSGTGADCGAGGGGGTNYWTLVGTDIYNTNGGNVGIGVAPGAYKLDIGASGSSGTFRIYDQTPVTGSTRAYFWAGAGQSTSALTSWLNNAGTTMSIVSPDGSFSGVGLADGFRKIVLYGGTSDALDSTTPQLGLGASSFIRFRSTNSWDSGSVDLGLYRNAAGVIEINNGTAGTYRDLKLRNAIYSGLAGSGTRCVQVDNTGQLAVATLGCAGTVGSGSGTIDFGNILDGACTSSTITVTGATAGAKVAPGWPSTLETNLIGEMIATASNTITVRLCNWSGVTVNPASQTFAATVF